MSKEFEEKIASLVSELMTYGFNRSLNVLEDAGAIDLEKMKKQYKGIGSNYYDMVTEQMNLTIEYAKPIINIPMVNIVKQDDAKISTVLLVCCSNLTCPSCEIQHYCNARFQINFPFRNAITSINQFETAGSDFSNKRRES